MNLLHLAELPTWRGYHDWSLLGALYHVISRGDGRKPIFEGGGDLAIKKALFQMFLPGMSDVL